MLKNLKNKIALVTGASSGIGMEISKKYLSAGAHVISIGTNLSQLEYLDDYAKLKGSSTTIVQLDLKDKNKIFSLSKELEIKFSHLDIITLNAAILGEVSPIEYYNASIWEDVISINLNANFYLLRSLTGMLKKSNEGNVIFVNCDMSKINNAYWGAYSVSKSSIAKLAEIYQEENKKIRVHTLSPPSFDTKLRAKAFKGIKVDNNKCKEAIDYFLKETFSNK